MKWLLFTNIETDINDNIIRMRCCLADYKFQRIIFTRDFELDDKLSVEMIEFEIIRYINDNVAIKDKIYLVCNLKSNTIKDNDLINKKMSKLSRYIKENIDLSTLWLIIDIYELHTKNVDKIDYCMFKVYGYDNNDLNNLNNDIVI